MTHNVGSLDQYIRYIIAMTLLTLGVVYESLWGLLGLVPLMTALMGWCPPYSLLGIQTCNVKK